MPTHSQSSFPVPPVRQVGRGIDVQTRRGISRKVEDRGQFTIESINQSVNF